MSEMETEYYCLNCGQKLEKNNIEKHMQKHKDEAMRVRGKITRQLQNR
jgi:DNA-directed RNA polymerase subunit RPC12/RpoP